jgi:hypothetical protein
MVRAETVGAMSSVVEYSPDSNYVSAEAEESPSLRAVTKQRLVKADLEDLVGALVTCKLCRSAITL